MHVSPLGETNKNSQVDNTLIFITNDTKKQLFVKIIMSLFEEKWLVKL